MILLGKSAFYTAVKPIKFKIIDCQRKYKFIVISLQIDFFHRQENSFRKIKVALYKITDCQIKLLFCKA